MFGESKLDRLQSRIDSLEKSLMDLRSRMVRLESENELVVRGKGYLHPFGYESLPAIKLTDAVRLLLRHLGLQISAPPVVDNGFIIEPIEGLVTVTIDEPPAKTPAPKKTRR